MLSISIQTPLLSFSYQSTSLSCLGYQCMVYFRFLCFGDWFNFLLLCHLSRANTATNLLAFYHLHLSGKQHGLWTARFYCSGVTKIWVVFLLSLCEDLGTVQISSHVIMWILVLTEVFKAISKGCRNPQVICVARDWQFPGQISNVRWGEKKKSTLCFLEDWYMEFCCHCNKNSPPTATLSSQTSQPISWECYKVPPAERARIRALNAISSLPGIVGIHTQSLPHAWDVLFQCRVCYCLQGHTVGFMEVPGIFCQAVTQIILVEFQNTCKEQELGHHFLRGRKALPAAVQESSTAFNICHFQYHWGKALCAVHPQSISSLPVFQLGF